MGARIPLDIQCKKKVIKISRNDSSNVKLDLAGQSSTWVLSRQSKVAGFVQQYAGINI